MPLLLDVVLIVFIPVVLGRPAGAEMSSGILELVLLALATAGAWLAVLYAVLAFRRTSSPTDYLTRTSAAGILRSETDIVKGSIQDQARWLRQELGQSFGTFQELILTTFGTLRDSIAGQLHTFGEQLDGGIKAIDDRAAAISAKLNDDMTQMRLEANTNREGLRTLVEEKLNQNISQQTVAEFLYAGNGTPPRGVCRRLRAAIYLR